MYACYLFAYKKDISCHGINNHDCKIFIVWFPQIISVAIQLLFLLSITEFKIAFSSISKSNFLEVNFRPLCKALCEIKHFTSAHNLVLIKVQYVILSAM